MILKYKQFFLFVCTGGVAALVNIFSRVLLSSYFEFGTAIVIAYIFGLLTAFFLAKIYVFKSKRIRLTKSFPLFLLVNIFAIFQTWIVAMFLRNFFLSFLNIPSTRELIAHIIGVLIPVFSSYFGHKYLSFNDNLN